MARIKDTSVDAVKAAANIVDLVEARTRLRKVGGRYTGLCPFHQEKTPSFSVSPDRGTYHCFGCGVGGDAISFVREIGGARLRRRDRVARRPLQRRSSSTRSRRREADAQRQAQGAALRAARPGGGVLRARALGRVRARPCRSTSRRAGSARRSAASSGSGSRPRARRSRRRRARRGSRGEELAGAGLVTRRGTDYFQRRLMFPLTDARGRIVGFQARKLHEDDPLRGKYVNSPESELFHKSHVLYGLHLARGAITKEDRALVVEGNTDVIALRQAGLMPVVASMGTALTEHQLRELKRLTQRLFLCFDSDAAGEEATLRGMELARHAGIRGSRRRASAGQGSRRRPGRLRGAARGGGAVRGAPRPARARPRARQAARVPARPGHPERDPGVARAARRVAARERPARVDGAAARGRAAPPPARRRRRG